MNKIFAVMAICFAIVMTGCTKVSDGYAGIRQTFSGEILDEPLNQGWNQNMFGDVIKVSTRNIVVDVSATPMVAERIPMATFAMKVNYGINAAKAPFIYKTEKAQHVTTEDGDVYLMLRYVEFISKSAINDVLPQYKALDVNDNRTAIEGKVKAAILEKLKFEGKADYLNINSVNIIDVKPPQSIINSSIAIVNSQNALQTKINEVEVAKQESIRMAELSKQTDANYVNLLKAQADKTRADAMLVAATKGSVSVWVIPDNVNAVGNLSK